MRATGCSRPAGDKKFGKARFRFAPMCNTLKSHKTAKEFFGNPWRKQAEIWKCLEKSLEAGTRPRDAGARFATLEARRGKRPAFVGGAANLCSSRVWAKQ